MRANRIAVATLAAVTRLRTRRHGRNWPAAASANPAQSSQPQVAAPLPLGYVWRGDLPGVRRLGAASRTARTTSSSATTTATRTRRSIFRSAPTTTSTRADRTCCSRRISSQAAHGACLHCRFRRTSAPRSTPGRSSRTASRRWCRYWMNPPYWVDFYKNAAKGNTPPVIKFSENGAELTGPPTGVALNSDRDRQSAADAQAVGERQTEYLRPRRYAAARAPLARSRARDGASADTANADPNAGEVAALRMPTPPAVAVVDAASDTRTGISRRRPAARRRLAAVPVVAAGGRGTGPQPDVTVTWKVHRGSSPVKFADEVIRLFNGGDTDKVMEATTTATFNAPGRLHAARAGQRRLGRRRWRRAVLLDECVGEGHGQVDLRLSTLDLVTRGPVTLLAGLFLLALHFRRMLLDKA